MATAGPTRGLATGVAGGVATIRADVGALSAQATLTVTGAPALLSLTVTPALLPVGLTLPLSPRPRPTGAGVDGSLLDSVAALDIAAGADVAASPDAPAAPSDCATWRFAQASQPEFTNTGMFVTLGGQPSLHP